MAVLDWLLGKRLSTIEEDQQEIGPLAGIPVLGLDALSSASYGPEAALTVLIPLGAAGLHFVGPLSALVVTVLLLVFVSYRQTIAAYPGGAVPTPSRGRISARVSRCCRGLRWLSTTS